MATRIQTVSPRGRRTTIAVMGDSHSNAYTLGVRADQYWPEVMGGKLRALGYPVRVRNFAVNGNTTTNMLTRVAELMLYDTPKLVIIFGGVNDPGASISSATTTANLQAMVKYCKNNAVGVVAVQTSLPSGSVEGDRYIVMGDTSTTGGVNPTSPTYATVTGTASGVQVWECRNGLASESGWSRVASYTTPIVSRFILVGPPFLNYTSGGDTAASGGSHSGQNATYSAVHTAVSTAVTNEGSGTSLCDVYDFEQLRILAGKDTAASASTHVAGTNQHKNVHGNEIHAQAVLAAVQAQSGTLALLA